MNESAAHRADLSFHMGSCIGHKVCLLLASEEAITCKGKCVKGVDSAGVKQGTVTDCMRW